MELRDGQWVKTTEEKAREAARKQISTGWNTYWENVPEWVRWAVLIGTMAILYALFGSPAQY